MPEFVVYIDEAGDEGFKFYPGEKGSSRWFILSAVVVRKSNESHIIRTLREVRTALKKPDKYAIHFRELRHEQRIPVARLVAAAPIRTVHILIHKPSINNPETFQREAFKLYRYATRLLVERVSWLCRAFTRGEGAEAELMFSNRSAMSYENLRDYLALLMKNSMVRDDISIDWGVIDSSRVSAVNHDKLAGLQMADAVATSLFYAVNKSLYGEVEDRYLQIIRKTVYRHNGRVDGYGLKFWCNDDAEKQRVVAVTTLEDLM